MFNIATKKDIEKIEKKIRNAFGKSKKEFADLRIELQNLVQVQVQKQVQNKSKTGLRQVQEKALIHKFRQSRKQQSRQLILEFAAQEIPIADMRIKVMSKFNISKASFHNYVNGLIQEGSLSPSLSPKCVLFRQKLDKEQGVKV